MKLDRIYSFEDESLKNGKFLIRLCNAVDHKSCDLSYISENDFISNAKYAISTARKMGIVIFFSWEDIVELNSHLIISFVKQLISKYDS